MSLTMGYQSLGVKLTGSTTTVPNDRVAKLMYYLDCVFAVIRYDGADRYTDYKNYYLLSKEEEQTVLGLAALFNPKLMIQNSLFIVDPDLVPPGSSNQFFEITDSKIGVHVNSEVVIGGVARKVLKIMTCTEDWLLRNYIDPVKSYTRPQLPSGYSSSHYRKEEECCECLCDELSCCETCFDCMFDDCCANNCGGCLTSNCKKGFCCIFFLILLILIIVIIIASQDQY